VSYGFKDQLKNAVDIVRTIGEYVRLKRLGSTGRYIGLCPFHNEKTPSFNVNADKQFYKCFGCGKGGDVFSFVMEIEGLGFFEAMKLLAERNSIPMPKERVADDPESRRRATLQELNELAARHFRDQLYANLGEAARQYLNKRGVGQKLAEEFNLGFSDNNNGLTRLFEKEGVPQDMWEPCGLILKRNDGPGHFDRFRGRLMFPITNESGKVIAFGGRALGDEQPKYLNSPETPIYRKSHVLYNLHRAREGARKSGRFVLVEGYMDVIGVHAAGVKEVVASCGTALRPEQIASMKRHADHVIVNFDPDPAGANATERSVSLLLEENLHLRVCSLSGGLDPDEYAKQHGAEAYREALERSPNYFYWLASRARDRFDTKNAEGRLEAFRFLMPSILKLPGKLDRLAVVNDLAGQLGVEQGAMLDQFRRAATDRTAKRSLEDALPKNTFPDTERLLLRLILHHPQAVQPYVDTILSLEDFPHLESRPMLEPALSLLEAEGEVDFHALSERLKPEQANLLAALFSSDTDNVEKNQEDPTRQVEACLAKLERDSLERKQKSLRFEVKDAERRGDLAEALRLMEQERNLERRLRTLPK
jgi:DNA primase